MPPFFANYGFNPQKKLMKEREAHNPVANNLCSLDEGYKSTSETNLENTVQSMKKYDERKATEELHIKVGDMVILNAKNIPTK